MNRTSTDLGEVLLPADDGYAEASSTTFATGAPALVVRPRDEEEVSRAVRHAIKQGLDLSVRSGGHSIVGHSTNTGGMVLDLRHLDTVELVDAEARIVRVGGGANWGQVAAALAPHGLGLTAGDTTSVGVGGLTLGGGIGWMVRKHGLAIDSLVGARVATADGRVIVASEDEHTDLFWALRGGGGNFGVVVSFYFVAQEVTTVRFGSISYQPDDVASLLAGWRDHMRTAPDELTSTLTLVPPLFGLPASATVLVCHAGDDPAAADETIAALLRLGTVTDQAISQRQYADILEDAHHPPGIRVVGRNVLVAEIDDDLIATITAAQGNSTPTVFTLRSLGGAFARVPAHATAFAHRDAEAMIIAGTLMAEDATDAEVDEALRGWRAVAARGTGTYVNFQGSATPDDVASAYPPATYIQLAATKETYDSSNVFARNHNVVPNGAAQTEGPAA